MRVLLIGPYFANAGHAAEIGVYDAIKENGHSCSIIDPRTKQYMDEDGNISTGLEIDHLTDINIALCLGPGLTPKIRESYLWKQGLPGAKKVIWNSEPLRLPNYYSRMRDNKDEFDFFFTFDESDIPNYNKLGIDNVGFLPQGYNPKWYNVLQQPLKGHFCFVGSVGGKWQNRVHFLNRVRRHCNNSNLLLTAITCFDAAQVNCVYSQHTAVLNLGLYHKEQGPVEELKSFGLQQRIFEAIGAGKIVITNEIPDGSNQLFTHGKDILFYNRNNLEDVLDMARDEETREQITENVLKIRSEHDYKARVKEMFAKLNDAGII